MKPAVALVLLLALMSAAAARGFMSGVGAGGTCVGAACIFYTVSGPGGGSVSTVSAPFAVTLSTGSFTGTQTITISDGAQGGTITPSVGAPGTSSVVVTPAAAATGFTFTYTPAATACSSTLPCNITLAFANAQGWTNAAARTYVSAITQQASLPLEIP